MIGEQGAQSTINEFIRKGRDPDIEEIRRQYGVGGEEAPGVARSRSRLSLEKARRKGGQERRDEMYQRSQREQQKRREYTALDRTRAKAKGTYEKGISFAMPGDMDVQRTKLKATRRMAEGYRRRAGDTERTRLTGKQRNVQSKSKKDYMQMLQRLPGGPGGVMGKEGVNKDAMTDREIAIYERAQKDYLAGQDEAGRLGRAAGGVGGQTELGLQRDFPVAPHRAVETLPTTPQDMPLPQYGVPQAAGQAAGMAAQQVAGWPGGTPAPAAPAAVAPAPAVPVPVAPAPTAPPQPAPVDPSQIAELISRATAASAAGGMPGVAQLLAPQAPVGQPYTPPVPVAPPVQPAVGQPYTPPAPQPTGGIWDTVQRATEGVAGAGPPQPNPLQQHIEQKIAEANALQQQAGQQPVVTPPQQQANLQANDAARAKLFAPAPATPSAPAYGPGGPPNPEDELRRELMRGNVAQQKQDLAQGQQAGALMPPVSPARDAALRASVANLPPMASEDDYRASNWQAWHHWLSQAKAIYQGATTDAERKLIEAEIRQLPAYIKKGMGTWADSVMFGDVPVPSSATR